MRRRVSVVHVIASDYRCVVQSILVDMHAKEMVVLRCRLANAMRVVLAALGKPLLQRVEGLTLRATRGLLASDSCRRRATDIVPS